ncbi:MAG: YtxH domain-containing protein [Muribaculaceae bacterium]
MKGVEIAIAALGGAVVGAAIALLFAPQSGKRTRCQLRQLIREKCPWACEKDVEKLADELENTVVDPA